MTTYTEQDTYRIHFDNLRDFFSYTSNCPPDNAHANNLDDHRSLITGNGDNFYYGEERKYSRYLDQRFNPEKGKRYCEKAVKDTLNTAMYRKLVKQAMTYKRKIHFEDHGAKLDVAKAIAGEDRYFVRTKQRARPSVKIAINICGSASVEQEQFITLAKTAVPVIYALETAGIPTEVHYVAFASNTFYKFKHVVTSVVIKSAQQRFNWTTFAPIFQLGSYRDGIFKSWIYQPHRVTGGLGYPMSDSDLSFRNNYGYTAVIGFNAPGADVVVNTVFEKIFKKS